MHNFCTLVLVLLISISIQKVGAVEYNFATDLFTYFTSFSDKAIELEVTRLDNVKRTSAFPVGTVFSGKIFEHKTNRRFLRDEY